MYQAESHDMPSLIKCRGYNIGTRLIDEFLAKSRTSRCLGFRDAMEKAARVSFKILRLNTCRLRNVAVKIDAKAQWHYSSDIEVCQRRGAHKTK